jgi:hypothetical protein
MLRSGAAVLSAVVAAVALMAVPAEAQQAPAVVAGPLPNGLVLTAFDRGARLCLQLRAPDTPEPADCLDALPDAPRHVRLHSVSETPGADWYAAVTPDVAAVELRFADGERVAAPTSPGVAYRGRFAGRVRFVVLASRSDEQPYLTRLLGADGHVVAAVGNPFAPAPILERPVTFASGRADGARWRAQAFVDAELRATPLEPDRLERVACVGIGPFRRGPVGPSGLRGEACADEGPLSGTAVVGFDSSCRPAGAPITGFVAPRVARLTAVLGDGRRRSIAVHTLPAAFGAGGPAPRAFAFVADRDAAVRRLEALDATGRRVATFAIGLAPARLSCGGPTNAAVFRILLGGFATHGSELAPPPGPPRLLVADDGVRLCFSLGRFGPDGADCGLPPLDVFESRILRQTTPAGTLVAGVLPAEVAGVRVRLSGGATIVVPTTPTVPGYTGRYAGAVRFFTLALARPRRAVGIDLLSGAGRRIAALPGPDVDAPRAVTVLRALGVRIGATAFAGVPCIAVGNARCGPPLGGVLDVTATCAPRRLVVTALLDARTTGLEVGLRDGRTIRARVVRLPAATGRRRLAVAVLPATAAPVRLVVRRGRSRRPASRPLTLPPAADQCGYASGTALPGTLAVGPAEIR